MSKLFFVLFLFFFLVPHFQPFVNSPTPEEKGKLNIDQSHAFEKNLLLNAQKALKAKKFEEADRLYAQLGSSKDRWYSWAGVSGQVVIRRKMQDWQGSEQLTAEMRKKRPELSALMYLWDADTARLAGQKEKAEKAYAKAQEQLPSTEKWNFVSQVFAEDAADYCSSPSNASDGFQYPIDFDPAGYGNNFLQDAAAVPGDYHPGVDLNGYTSDCGKSFYATARGCVLEATNDSDGNGYLDDWGSLTIQHYFAPYQSADSTASTNYWVSQYAHARTVYYSAGMAVEKGDELGLMDGVGTSGTPEFDCHLHFEIREPDHPDKDNPSAWEASTREETANYYEDPIAFVDAHTAYSGGLWFDEGAFLYPTAKWTADTIGAANDMLYASTNTTRTAYAQTQLQVSDTGTYTLWMFVPWEHGTSKQVPVTLYQDNDWVDKSEISAGTSTIIAEAEVNQYGDDSDSTECGGSTSSSTVAQRNCDRWLKVFSADLTAGTKYVLDVSNNTGETGKTIALDMFLLLEEADSTVSLYSLSESTGTSSGSSGTDTDGDGLTDDEESELGTYAWSSDTDKDLLEDGEEVYTYGTDPTDKDTDDDSLDDWKEVAFELDPLDTDTDDDGLTDGYEIAHGEDAHSADGDNDGLLDGEEVSLGTSTGDADTDDDGLQDGDEVNVYGTNPLDADTDDDGISDADELPAGSGLSVADTLTAKIEATDGSDHDYFGYAVDVSDDVIVIGAWGYGVSTSAEASGAAYVYRWDGSSWNEEAKLTASDAYADDRFGYSVAIDGDVVAIGAFYDDTKAAAAGAVYVFRWNGSSWAEEAELTASDGSVQDFLGYSVDVQGNHIIAGAIGDDDKGDFAGAAYIFYWNGSSWEQQKKLTASDGAADDDFGISVSIDEDKAVVGSPFDDDNGSASGSAYVYSWDGSDWSGETKLADSNGGANDQFGYDVDLSGERIVISSPEKDVASVSNTGAVFIYHLTESTWDREITLTSSDVSASDRFGTSVSISGDKILVGAYDDYVFSSYKGSVYAYSLEGNDWYEITKIKKDYDDDYFGLNVGISSSLVVTGAYWDSDIGMASGAAYTYDLSDVSNLYSSAILVEDVNTTTYTVTSTADTNDGKCNSSCTLREALAISKTDTSTPEIYIEFEIPSTDSGCSATTGLCTISPSKALPSLTRGHTTIDGGGVIVIDGTSAGSTTKGLTINNASSNVIKDLQIVNFANHGIYITGSTSSDNEISDCTITDNLGSGIYSAASSNTLISNNILAENGKKGVHLYSSSTIGAIITQNSMYDNVSTGIALASGANNSKAKPVMSSATISGTTVTITGTATAGDKVEVFLASTDTEGQTYIDSTTADASGNWSLTTTTTSAPKSSKVLATATDSTNGTSVFSGTKTMK